MDLIAYTVSHTRRRMEKGKNRTVRRTLQQQGGCVCGSQGASMRRRLPHTHVTHWQEKELTEGLHGVHERPSKEGASVCACHPPQHDAEPVDAS
jgi:hypothetical protein